MRTPWPPFVCAFIAIAAIVFSPSRVARAEGAEATVLRVELRVDRCVAVDANEVRRIVALELRAAVWDPAEHDPKTVRIDVVCVDQGVELRVLDPLTGKSLARVIALGEIAANARARLLALAIAELVSASWSELESNPEPAVLPAAPTPRAEEKKAARGVVARRLQLPPTAPPTAWRVTATLGTRWMTVGSDPFVGVGVRAGAEPFRRVGFVLDLAVEHATTASTLGSIGVDSYSLGAAVMARADVRPLVLRGGAGARFGIVRMVGFPDAPDRAEGHAVTGAWGAPIALGSASVRIGQRLLVELMAETGYVVLPVRGVAAGGRDARVDGLFVGGGIGIGIEL